MAVDDLPIESKLLNSFTNVGEWSVSNPPHFIRQRYGAFLWDKLIMATKLTTNLSIETARLRIKSLIEFESTDRFKTHFNQIFNSANDKYVLGTVDDNSFKIWIGGRRGVTGIFYPIINGT